MLKDITNEYVFTKIMLLYHEATREYMVNGFKIDTDIHFENEVKKLII